MLVNILEKETLLAHCLNCLSHPFMTYSFQAHVGDILRSKFTTFNNFHTLLYTCAKEFDFLGWEMPVVTSQTLLLPSAIIAVVLVLVYYVKA